MSAVVSLLWAKNADVLDRYLKRAPSKVYTAAGLEAALTDDERRAIAVDAGKRADAIRERAEASGMPSVFTADLSQRLSVPMLMVAALDRVHATDGIDEIVLNEDVMAASKAAALWAKDRGVPTVMLSHSCILGRLYTVHREANPDRIAVFGARGAQPYEDLGVDPSRLAVTGNPAWDGYPDLAARRAEIRVQMRASRSLPADEPLIVFATTWSANFTAFCDADAYERSLHAVLNAVKLLAANDIPVRLIVKDRPSNEAKGAYVAAAARAAGIEDRVTFTYDDMERWMVAADVVISVDSNVAIEAALSGVPAVNLWTEMSWLNGPFFGAEDGVLEVGAENLADGLLAALGNADLRAHLTRQATQRVPEFAGQPGLAAQRAADLMFAARKPLDRHPRYVWEELSNPLPIEAQGEAATYNHHPRVELLNLLNHPPRTVLDVGCAAGATGAELKRIYPQAVVHGVELSPASAAIARTKLDRVLNESIETMDFAAAGFAPKSIDVVFLPDVLEHLYDPWQSLARMKPFLSDDAQILASIPNVRNLWLIGELLAGKWDYLQEGLLDVTHIRFFTRRTIGELFDQTGYSIFRWGINLDPRVPIGDPTTEGTFNIETPKLTLKNLNATDLQELRTIQFLVAAVPTPLGSAS
jgi:SAM-dependent methyltransferase